MTSWSTTVGVAARPRTAVVLLSLPLFLPLILPLALVVGTASAATSGSTLRLSPTSGGPGTQVEVRGVGFCARAACQPATVRVDGGQVRDGLRPGADGSFRTSVTMPGGLIAGDVIVSARQVLDDGNELVAESTFTYAPSKGEASEQDAETRDLLTTLVNPTAPRPSPRGQPLASVPSSATPTRQPAPVPAPSSTPEPSDAVAGGSKSASNPSVRWWWIGALVGLAGLAPAWVVRAAWRRKHSLPPH